MGQSFEFRTVVLNWLPTETRNLKLYCHLICSWEEVEIYPSLRKVNTNRLNWNSNLLIFKQLALCIEIQLVTLNLLLHKTEKMSYRDHFSTVSLILTKSFTYNTLCQNKPWSKNELNMFFFVDKSRKRVKDIQVV